MPAGQVIATSPAGGAAAPYGSTVTVTVSSGPADDDRAQRHRDTVTQATAALQAAGLTVSGVSGNPNNNVAGTQPSDRHLGRRWAQRSAVHRQ